MSQGVAALLKRLGPSMTSDVIDALVSDGLSPATARQRITRAQSTYVRLAGVRFAKNARFIYLNDQYGTPKYWSALLSAFEKAGKSYWSAIVSLMERGGKCPKPLFSTISCAPLARKGQLSPDRLLERLSNIQLLKTVEDGETEFVQFLPLAFGNPNDAEVRANLIAEDVALFGMKEWVRTLGFGSHGKVAVRNEGTPPVVAGLVWDLTAPSYVRPLVQFENGKIKPGFIVADINLRGHISKDAMEAYVRKCDMASAPVNMSRLMPIYIASYFSEEAFSLAKSKGVLALTTSMLFGSELAKALTDLVKLLTDQGATAAVNPDQLEKVMSTLTKIEGAAANIRGTLFEFVVGSLVKNVEGGSLKVGERIKHHATAAPAEIDVQLRREDVDDTLIIETKAKLPGARVSVAEVKHWYSNRVPLINEIVTRDGYHADKKLRFELWSNGPITDDAAKWLETQPTQIGNYSVGWKDGKGLKEYADKATDAALRKILNEHYFLHPLRRRDR